jgi:hydroxymethylpyrimidine/phosphomethylpyrimidine kinase
VLAKGAHLSGDEIVDALVTSAGVETFANPRIETTSTHGTGCTLASAIAAGIAQGIDLRDAVEGAILYVREAIRTAPGFGSGAGPVNHAHPVTGGGLD